ncbi:bcl-2/adenovirus E1B 19 kDa-interacting protein 2-like protein [Nothobranchius furzeri]|uniref:Bcl-2/adenovirus E1B 19 kDa-interacting protein 2-like protein n=2 Tax=Nothobranchius furzeri TaxID=105023 RepID=A0A9D2XCH5_NOTFU|nr:bcl-2/adenovirus E1B 19 kDa-interacting protein 2-like protein [Nothobranchius furzeri]KAF7198694.1 bcl-2/adenovirus E1B 19 kDa-interacting protein 2-like protein [Nothobranchius furzeri]
MDRNAMDRPAPGASGAPNIQDLELREEWQDDEFPRPLPEDGGDPEESVSPVGGSSEQAPSTSLALCTGERGAKKRLAAPALNLTLSHTDSHDKTDSFSAAALSGTPDDTPSLDINLEALETPSGSETGTLPDSMHELEWEDDLPQMEKGGAVGVASSPVEHSEGLMELDQVDSKGRRWRKFCISGYEYRVNMSVLEPYLQVLSHGGYYGDGMNAIILFTSCYLPESTVENYDYVMDNLFRYIIGTLDLMVSENYVLVYLCAMAPRNKLPAIKWLHQCYTSIDRRLKKDLKGLLVVHPAWYIKAIITVVKPFISDKFSRKIRFIQSLQHLGQIIPTERLQIPDAIQEYDQKLNR